MKYMMIIILFVLTGCMDNKQQLINVNQFNNDCRKLAECMNIPYKVKFDPYNIGQPAMCLLELNKYYEAVINPLHGFDFGKKQSFGYLKASLTVCKILKEKGKYSKENLSRDKLLNDCISYSPRKEQKDACIEQYK